MTIKTFTRRDSATATLRKMGINSRDYNLFIKANATHPENFDLDLGLAQAHLIKLADLAEGPNKRPVKTTTKPLTEAQYQAEANRIANEKPAKAAKAEKKVKAAKTHAGEDSVSAVMRQMLLAGKTNLEVWEHCQPLFNLDEKKRGYPAWYRTELKNKGLLPKGEQA